MTNEEILSVFEGISKLKSQKINLNIKVSFRIAQINQILLPFVEIIEKEKNKILFKYGEKKEDGSVIIPKTNIELAENDLNLLMKIYNNIKDDKIKLDDFGNIDFPYEITEKLIPIIEM